MGSLLTTYSWQCHLKYGFSSVFLRYHQTLVKLDLIDIISLALLILIAQIGFWTAVIQEAAASADSR